MLRQIGLVLLLTATASAQDESRRDDADEGSSSDKITFDFSFDYDPAELREHVYEKLRWKRIWGPIGIEGMHVFPSRESGPYEGPPTRIWGNGFATSLWRDPVTGWPLQ